MTISGGNGVDTITFTNTAAGTTGIDGGALGDAIYVDTAATALTNFNGTGSIAGGDGADTIVAAGIASGGSISGGAGADSILLTNFSAQGSITANDATINGGAGTDTIVFKTTAGGATFTVNSAIGSAGIATIVYEAGDVIGSSNCLHSSCRSCCKRSGEHWFLGWQLYWKRSNPYCCGSNQCLQ